MSGSCALVLHVHYACCAGASLPGLPSPHLAGGSDANVKGFLLLTVSENHHCAQVMGLGFAVIAPFILPPVAFFFFTAWVRQSRQCGFVHLSLACHVRAATLLYTPCACPPPAAICNRPPALPRARPGLPLQLAWRYCALHFYERSYESGGRVFETLFTLSVRLTVDDAVDCEPTGMLSGTAGCGMEGRVAAAVWTAGRTLLRLAWSCCIPRTLCHGTSSPQPGLRLNCYFRLPPTLP